MNQWIQLLQTVLRLTGGGEPSTSSEGSAAWKPREKENHVFVWKSLKLDVRNVRTKCKTAVVNTMRRQERHHNQVTHEHVKTSSKISSFHKLLKKVSNPMAWLLESHEPKSEDISTKIDEWGMSTFFAFEWWVMRPHLSEWWSSLIDLKDYPGRLVGVIVMILVECV